jgi:hypothetical protein
MAPSSANARRQRGVGETITEEAEMSDGAARLGGVDLDAGDTRVAQGGGEVVDGAGRRVQGVVVETDRDHGRTKRGVSGLDMLTVAQHVTRMAPPAGPVGGDRGRQVLRADDATREVAEDRREKRNQHVEEDRDLPALEAVVAGDAAELRRDGVCAGHPLGVVEERQELTADAVGDEQDGRAEAVCVLHRGGEIEAPGGQTVAHVARVTGFGGADAAVVERDDVEARSGRRGRETSVEALWHAHGGCDDHGGSGCAGHEVLGVELDAVGRRELHGNPA